MSDSAGDCLAQPLTVLTGVGPRRAAALAARGLRNIGDLLFHLPARYDDRRALAQVGDLEVGRRATFVAEVRSTGWGAPRGRRGRLFRAVVGDETGSVTLTWFRGGEALEPVLSKGGRLLVTGEVTRYRFSKQLVHPEVERVDEPGEADEGEGLEALRRIVPEYAAPEGVNPRTLRRLVGVAVETYANQLPGHLPEALVRERGLPDAVAALRAVHAPEQRADLERYHERRSAAHERLVLEELYLLELGLALRRSALARLPGIAIDTRSPGAREAPARLPFELTGAQRRVWSEIGRDLRQTHPMSRLLQGDVGSGKTAVALLAAIATALAGHQSALMAPTELLAAQHARSLARLLGADATREAGSPPALRVDPGSPPALRVGLLTASLPRAQARGLRSRIAAGEIDLVVGTHALVQEELRFASLALAVVDEQHRFGVRQRAALSAKAPADLHPHVLVMTATPIPRTLALTLYGDLDLSVLDELPPGREPAETRLLRAGEGRLITERVRDALGRGEQVYVVYPLVEESESLDLRAAAESAERIRAAFPQWRVDLVHGRLDAQQRAEVMERFESGDTQILVSTSVIEVGVDVPRATLMIVEHAERFGLAQLHQLRGRVGRGETKGTCLLVARGGGADAEARLRAMLRSSSGFEIADEDLRIRGPGEFLGTRQHGHLPDLRISDLVRDSRLVSVAREAALERVRCDPGLRGAPELRRAVELRWGERLALAGVG